jgi:putative hemolysin
MLVPAMVLDVILLLVAALAMVARALSTAADAALTGVSPERAEELLEERNDLTHRALLALKQDPEGTAATVRGGAVAGLAVASALAGVVGLRLLGTPVEGLPLVDPIAAAVIAATAGGLAVSLSALVLDLLPRSLAIVKPEEWAERLAVPVRVAHFLAAPVAGTARRLLDRLLRPFGAKATFAAAAPALEDLERFLEQEAREDEDAPSAELVRSLFEFPSKIAREVMVPRTLVTAIPLDTPPEEVVRIVAEEGHSRMPVYEGEIDRIVGVLHSRDLVPLLTHPELIKLPDAIRPPVFVPWATKIGHLLREMQRKRVHMAMVTDEYGGFIGIVTLEDILEELVGDIQDEHDVPEPKDVQPQPDGTWLVSTRVPIHEFNEALGVELPEEESYETLAGFLNELAGQIPEIGARLQAHGLAFTVIERSPRRVRRVRVARLPETAKAE